MHVYNAIIVMKEILPVFPLAAVTDTGASLDAAMDRFLESEERGDLKILGRAYVLASITLLRRLTCFIGTPPVLRKERRCGLYQRHIPRFVTIARCCLMLLTIFCSYHQLPLPNLQVQVTTKAATAPPSLVVQALMWSPLATDADQQFNPRLQRHQPRVLSWLMDHQQLRNPQEAG